MIHGRCVTEEELRQEPDFGQFPTTDEMDEQGKDIEQGRRCKFCESMNDLQPEPDEVREEYKALAGTHICKTCLGHIADGTETKRCMKPCAA